MLALIVLGLGGFATLVLLWMAAWNNGAWAATPTERRQRVTWAVIVFSLTVTVASVVVWRGFRRRVKS